MKSLTSLRSCSSAALLACTLMVAPHAWADPVSVRNLEGALHGYLALHSAEGKLIAYGDLIQTVKGSTVTAELVFHFKDGSLDDDNFVYEQGKSFRLLTDHHVQSGPSFPKPIDVSIDVPHGIVKVRSEDGGKPKDETTHMDLPADLANGIILTLLKNVEPSAGLTTVSYVAATPKPRLVQFKITPADEDSFTTAGARHKATRFHIKIDIGGVSGVIAPLVGKQPSDSDVWIAGGRAPAFVKSKLAFYLGGPLWTIELTNPVWSGEGSK